MSGIEYIKEDLSQHPQCIHGPTFLLERETEEGFKKFFACSACRDRKDCSFFLWEEDKEKHNTEKNTSLLKQKQEAYANINHEELYSIFKKICETSEESRYYCFHCNLFLLEENKNSHDRSHRIVKRIIDGQLSNPSTFLEPLENDKREAQYLFSESAVIQTIQILQDLQIKDVICIGAPRIHEYIQNASSDLKSILLDFDRRFHNFYPPDKFLWYNMFNHHFFRSECGAQFSAFLRDSRAAALVMDPPFGGRIEPLAQTIAAIQQQLKAYHKPNLHILLFFPYFMEAHIKNHIPELNMSDYKVDYDNHKLFASKEKARKYGSPVRIFTSIPLEKIRLSPAEYEYCELCEKYVYRGNRHCYQCGTCSGKDGRTWVHCAQCARCVKPSWTHCRECARCAQPQHDCSLPQFTKTCYHCHQKGHKKTQCPQVNIDSVKRKRKEKNKTNKKIKR